MVERAEQELCSDIERALLTRAHVNRRIPIEPQLTFAIVRLRLDSPRFQRRSIDAADGTSLGFRVDVARIGRIWKGPEAISVIKVFPAAVTDTARIRGIAYPRAVILQATEYVVGVLHVHADVIKLRDGKIVGLPPGVSAVVRIPNAAIVPGDQVIRVLRIDPYIMEITVRAADNAAETLAAILAHDEYQIRLVQFDFVLRIDQQVRKIKRAPHHPTAAVTFFPGLAAIAGTKQRATIRFDERINHARI